MKLRPIAFPFVLTQEWGVPNPVYQQFGFKRHNGVDVKLGKDAKVFAPHEGTVTSIGWQPEGAGLYLSLRSSDRFPFEEGDFYALSTLMHLSSVSVQIGQTVQAGDLLAIADNTGFSTGPHTHWRLRCLRKSGSAYKVAVTNDANDSVDPMPYVEAGAGYFFTKDLYLGMTDPDVRELQRYLNAHGAPVSPSGAGSAGKETDYYGDKTKAALTAFQAKNGIPATGYCGPLTRAKLNA